MRRSGTASGGGRRPRWRTAGAYALLCALLAPLTIVLHEVAHYVTALALGFPDVEFHFSAIAHGDIGGRPGWQSGLVGLAGPAATIAFILAAIALGRRRPGTAWPHALAFAAASRLLVGVPYTLANSITRLSGGRLDPPAFDEYKAGVALGVSGDAMLGASVAFFFVAIVWLARALPKGRRLAAWAGLLAGTALGWALWMALLGPILLP